MLRFATAVALLLGVLSGPRTVAAQDVELLGERYGTPVPDAYRALRSRAPDAFRFSRGRALRSRTAPRIPDGGTPGVLRTTLGPRAGPVEGTVSVPVLLGLFGDTEGGGGYDAATVAQAYFADDPGTIRRYYDEVSLGRVELLGDVLGWFRGAPERTRRWVTNGDSGLGADGRVGRFIEELVDAAEAQGIDWGRYDNDGPDGLPNSGDDDGFVDVVAVLHPTRGGECGGTGSENRIWSHRWSLSSSTGRARVTASPAAGGGRIRVDDYIIQPIRSCTSPSLNEIGVFTHELGHAFGLPDLYDTVGQDGAHQGAGTWDLMSTGSWGCDNASPDHPCHMGAWSRVQLGWAEVVEVPAGTPRTEVTLPPVETTGRVYRVHSADGSGEYFLLENRQRLGFDASLPRDGLLVWQIDPDWVTGLWRVNEVNGYRHRGVWLRQADGLDDLGRADRGRGDAGDPFPFEAGGRENRVFHAGSDPAAVAYRETATGVTLLDIRRAGPDVTFDVLTRRVRVTLRTEDDGPEAGFSVDGSPVSGRSHSFLSAPFERHLLEAAPGRPLEPGVRRPFHGWLDDPLAPRVRPVVTGLGDAVFTARYQGRQLEVAVEVRGGVDGVEPAEFITVPYAEDLWFEEGTELSIEVRPERGFSFVGWTGALAGQTNPADLTVDEPLEAGADFELVYEARSTSATVEATTEQVVTLEVENGTDPVTWTVLQGPLPLGLRLDPTGVISGVPLVTGSFPLRFRAEDGLGLRAEADVTLVVAEPTLGLDLLASAFLLTGPTPTSSQERFLDLRGNDNGSYDLGDFRAWILNHPGLPMTAPVRAPGVEPVRLRVTAGARGTERAPGSGP